MNAAPSTVPLQPFSQPIPVAHFRWFLGLHLLFATMATLFLVMEGAGKEPFVRFIPAEAISQVGLGCFLIAAWFYIVGAVLYGVASRRLHPACLAALPWAAIMLFYLRLCPQGYVADVHAWLSSALP